MAVPPTPQTWFGMTSFSEFLQESIVQQSEEPGATHVGSTEEQ